MLRHKGNPSGTERAAFTPRRKSWEFLRLESPNSRREICMELTQKGKDKLKEVTPAVSKLHRGLLTTMGDMELEGFEKVLRKMEVFFEDYIGEEKHDHNT
jgi:hypothetical protein